MFTSNYKGSWLRNIVLILSDHGLSYNLRLYYDRKRRKQMGRQLEYFAIMNWIWSLPQRSLLFSGKDGCVHK